MPPNRWIKESIQIANGFGYYDKLLKIYPMSLGKKRKIIRKEQIKKCYDEKKPSELFEVLLRQKKFPIEDPYVAGFRRGYDFSQNPQTIERIMDKVFDLNYSQIEYNITKPPKPSRQAGHLFSTWLKSSGIPFVSKNRIKTIDYGFLKGSDTSLKKFANKELNYNMDKGLDFVLKIEDYYFIAEAKFLTDFGGTQNNQLKSALDLTRLYQGPAIPIAILDGVCWIENRAMLRKICTNNKNSMTVLLLNKFLYKFLKDSEVSKKIIQKFKPVNPYKLIN